MLPVILLAVLLVFFGCLLTKSSDASVPHHVPAATCCRFLPIFVNRFLFVFNGRSIIHNGYKKYKDVPFRIPKLDTDLLVLPVKYLDQIRPLGRTKLSLLDAQFDNVCGDFTNILNDSNLPAYTVAKRLTPALNRIVPKVIDELKHAFDKEVPKCNDDWVSVSLYYLILNLINRSTSRIIVGDKLCRSEQWLATVTKYTEALGTVIVCLRPLPRCIRPLAAKFLPQTRYLTKTLEWVKEEIFVPMIVERREAEAEARNNPNSTYEKPDDFMQWMMDLADNDYDKEPGNIAHGLMVIMALAIIHTSTMLITQGIYDLLLHPEYLAPLRLEIKETLRNGWDNATKADFAAQVHLDSFLRESQRLNPTSEVNVQRIAKETIVLDDGFMIPKGSHICFAAGPLSYDPELLKSPDMFHGFRWCEGAESTNANNTASSSLGKNGIVNPNVLNLHFGYGRSACPGRFFASNTSKAILSRLLVEYDIKFADDEWMKLPRNFRNGEQIFANVYTRVLIKETGVKA